MTNFKLIDEARKTLGLKEDASLEEIKEAYRSLSMKFHPDKCAHKDKKRYEEEFKRITQARDTVLRYCANYRFSFKEHDVKKNALDRQTYEHLKRFYDGWMGDLGL